MSEFTKSPVVAGVALIAALGVAAGCGKSSQNESNSSHSSQNCTAVELAQWRPTPSNINVEMISGALHVSRDRVMGGMYGSASCSEEVSLDSINNNTAVIGSIKGEGGPCLVIGTQEDPRTITATRHILVVCAAGDAPA